MVSPLSPRERRLISEVCAAYGRWAPVDERSPPRLLHPLPGGFSNRNVLLAGQHRRYVLRIGAGPSRPGVSRWREARLLPRAAAAGVAPRTLYCDPRRGLLITAELPCIAPDPRNPLALARLLRRIHRLPCPGLPMDSATQLDAYRARLDPHSPCALLLQRGAGLLKTAREHGQRSPVPTRTCHNDLLSANRCWTGERYIALDWEYAAPGNPFFDLAVCASQMSDSEGSALLEAYLGRRARRDEQRHFSAQTLNYAALEACWWQCYGPEQKHRDAAMERLARRLERGLTP